MHKITQYQDRPQQDPLKMFSHSKGIRAGFYHRQNALKQAHDIQVNVIVRPNERKLTVATCNRIELFRESSFNTTRGG